MEVREAGLEGSKTGSYVGFSMNMKDWALESVPGCMGVERFQC